MRDRCLIGFTELGVRSNRVLLSWTAACRAAVPFEICPLNGTAVLNGISGLRFLGHYGSILMYFYVRQVLLASRVFLCVELLSWAAERSRFGRRVSMGWAAIIG